MCLPGYVGIPGGADKRACTRQPFLGYILEKRPHPLKRLSKWVMVSISRWMVMETMGPTPGMVCNAASSVG
jgi:hypothetical protein